MPEIIKHGKYPEKNKHTCEECGCEFKYWNNEVEVSMTTPDEESFFGGLVVCRLLNVLNVDILYVYLIVFQSQKVL